MRVLAPWHADSVVDSEYADLVAVCDVDVPKGEAFAEKYGTAFYQDYRQMIAEGGLDAVSICTPSGLHSEMTVGANCPPRSSRARGGTAALVLGSAAGWPQWGGGLHIVILARRLVSCGAGLRSIRSR